jgi:META domain
MRVRFIIAAMTLAFSASCAVPAYQLDLPGTRWSIVSRDGVQTEAPHPALRFGEQSNDATLSMACGQVPLDWIWDTDGSALSLTPRAIPASCASEQDAAVLRAIRSVEEWKVQSDGRITLRGREQLVLERGPN